MAIMTIQFKPEIAFATKHELQPYIAGRFTQRS